ncbi:hypothetical protein V5799_010122 [Amblyomma americanum]|uniref:Uncharacterized protein n=1 Tax=Amblyomma americanum TaxID=6943 RepID=A0AAQ4F8Z9_AMBAM
MSVHNFRLYGLHSAYVKEATLSCNDSFLESTVDVQLRDLEVISDWTAASWVMLAGSAHLVADALELECSILMPAEEGSRVVVSSMRLVELRISSVNVTGPFSTIWLEVAGGGPSSGLYTLRPEHRPVARVLEQILVRIAQRRLDRVEWAV